VATRQTPFDRQVTDFRSRLSMKFLVSQPFIDPQPSLKRLREYPVLGARPFTAKELATAAAVLLAEVATPALANAPGTGPIAIAIETRPVSQNRNVLASLINLN